MTLRLGERVSAIERVENGSASKVRIHLASGKQIVAEKVLYGIGRTGATAKLNLQAAGLKPDDRGRLKVNPTSQTEAPHIYAAGDIIGFPSLASTSMEQGRLPKELLHDFNVSPDSFQKSAIGVPKRVPPNSFVDTDALGGWNYVFAHQRFRSIGLPALIYPAREYPVFWLTPFSLLAPRQQGLQQGGVKRNRFL